MRVFPCSKHFISLREIYLIHENGRKKGREGKEAKRGEKEEGRIKIRVLKNDLDREYAPLPPSMKMALWSKHILQFNSMLLIS